MKIIQEDFAIKKQEIVAPVKQEYKKIGSIVLKRGLTLFEFDFEKKTIKSVEIKRENPTVDFSGRIVNKSTAIYNPNALYVQALNIKNAEKKVLKLLIKNNLIKKN